jgi:sugar transferase (PEP-CTERM/EpsH1 system associated)
LAHRAPFPPNKGDRIRTWQTIRHLATWADVHLAALADEPVHQAAPAVLAEHCVSVAIVPLPRRWRWMRALGSFLRGRTVTEGAFASPSLRRLLRRWCGKTAFQAVLASGSSLIPYLRLPCFAGVRKVVDLMDVDSQKWFDLAANSCAPRRWIYRAEAMRLRTLEAELPAWVDGVTLVSDAETALLRQFANPGLVRTVPMGVDLEACPPWNAAGEPRCVFVGALDYAPNVDAVCWFCSEVWPAVRERVPNATLTIVGRRPCPAVLRNAALPGVAVVGDVADVRPHVARAAVSIAPLRVARGVQAKVLEALAMGKAAVVSPEALKGIRATPGEHVLCADSAADWTAAVVRLLDDPELRERLGRAGRRFVEEEHDASVCPRGFDSLLGRPAELGAFGHIRTGVEVA